MRLQTALQPPRKRQGFTLLELLVVLAMVALVAGVAGPPVARWFESAELRGWRADLKARIEQYPVQAFLAGEPQEIDAKTLIEGLTAQPVGARVTLSQPLRYSAMGQAEGARVTLEAGSWTATWEVLPFTGQVQELTP